MSVLPTPARMEPPAQTTWEATPARWVPWGTEMCGEKAPVPAFLLPKELPQPRAGSVPLCRVEGWGAGCAPAAVWELSEPL